MNNTRTLSLIVAILFVLAASPLSANASHSWGGYHWARTSNPFTLQLGNNLSSAWSPYLGTTSGDWSTSKVLDTVVVAGQAKGKCRPNAGRIEVCNGAYGNNGWLGLAQIWLSGGHISQGSVKVNDTYFAMPKYNNSAEKNHVMCQEVGHTFGLDHQDESGAALGTCMDYSSDSGSQHPNAHDYQELEIIYSHVDSTTTVGSSTTNIPAEMKGDFDAPGAWGRLVKASKRTAVYERDFGNGNKIYTFVYLTHDGQ
jgi:hypothetical protein